MLPQIVTTIFDKVFPDPVKNREAKTAYMEAEQRGDLAEAELAMNAIVTEAKSKDPWTSRARPSFMYVFYTLLLIIPIAALVGVFFPEHMTLFFQNLQLGFKAIPNELYMLFGAGYLGYSASRSYDKKKMLEGQQPGGILSNAMNLFKK